MKEPKVGSIIKTFGQQVKIVDIDNLCNKNVYYLEHSIVTTDYEYTRDYVYLNEIQEIIYN